VSTDCLAFTIKGHSVSAGGNAFRFRSSSSIPRTPSTEFVERSEEQLG